MGGAAPYCVNDLLSMEERWAGLLLIVLMNDLLNMEERWAGLLLNALMIC